MYIVYFAVNFERTVSINSLKIEIVFLYRFISYKHIYKIMTTLGIHTSMISVLRILVRSIFRDKDDISSSSANNNYSNIRSEIFFHFSHIVKVTVLAPSAGWLETKNRIKHQILQIFNRVVETFFYNRQRTLKKVKVWSLFWRSSERFAPCRMHPSSCTISRGYPFKKN